jgi:hypothetical protein
MRRYMVGKGAPCGGFYAKTMWPLEILSIFVHEGTIEVA